MVNNAAIVSIIKKISDKNSAPCKKTLQKMVFLIEAKQVDLGCAYGIHFYGPYSSDLDFAVRELCDEDVLNIEYTNTEHRISIKDDSAIEEYNNQIVDEIVDEFAEETPSELELLATALYVYLNDKDINRIKRGVIKIKGNKYSEKRIDEAIKRLRNNGFLAA